MADYNRAMISPGNPELIIVSVVTLFLVFGGSIARRLEVRALTFERKTDVLIGISLVVGFLAAILLTTPK